MSRPTEQESAQRWAFRSLGIPLEDEVSVEDEAGELRLELVRRLNRRAWKWLTARDLDGKPIWWTKDERDSKRPVKPFPRKPHLKRILDAYQFSGAEVFLLDKSRQMMATTSAVLYAHYVCSTQVGRRCILSKTTEAEAIEVLTDKVRFPWSQTPEWFQGIYPIQGPLRRIDYPNTGSYIMAVGQNVADAEARGGTASLVIVDEAARQDSFEQILAACLPMASMVIAITTAELGGPGAAYYYQLLERGAEEYDG